MKTEIEIYQKFTKYANFYFNEDLAFYREIYFIALTGVLQEFHTLKLNNSKLSDEDKKMLEFIHDSNHIFTLSDRLDYLYDLKILSYEKYVNANEIIKNLDNDIIKFI